MGGGSHRSQPKHVSNPGSVIKKFKHTLNDLFVYLFFVRPGLGPLTGNDPMFVDVDFPHAGNFSVIIDVFPDTDALAVCVAEESRHAPFCSTWP